MMAKSYNEEYPRDDEEDKEDENDFSGDFSTHTIKLLNLQKKGL